MPEIDFGLMSVGDVSKKILLFSNEGSINISHKMMNPIKSTELNYTSQIFKKQNKFEFFPGEVPVQFVFSSALLPLSPSPASFSSHSEAFGAMPSSSSSMLSSSLFDKGFSKTE